MVYTGEGNATGEEYYDSRVTEKTYSLNSSYIVGYGSIAYNIYKTEKANILT